MRRGTALAIVAAVPIAACGSSGSPLIDQPTAAGARAAIQRYLDDLIKGNGADACGLLTAKSRRLIASSSGRGCAGVLDEAHKLLVRGRLLARTEAYAQHVHPSVHGDTATVPNFGSRGTSLLSFTNGSRHVGQR